MPPSPFRNAAKTQMQDSSDSSNKSFDVPRHCGTPSPLRFSSGNEALHKSADLAKHRRREGAAPGLPGRCGAEGP